jgi:iron complex outermembrane receptor protein
MKFVRRPMLAKIGLFVGAILISTGSVAATIKGIIRDVEKKQPLGGVTVMLMSPALKEAQVVITEDSGVYSFKDLPPGAYTIISNFGSAKNKKENIVINADDKSMDVDVAITLAQAGGETYNITVTAQKAEEKINDVGMSIQAATGKQLTKLGIKDTAGLEKIVPGFQSTQGYFGNNNPTIRGIGFQDRSLAGGPTVSVYIDEAPLPFSALNAGATLDLERVEVLKGPQGTLFGQNATGGAINYIAALPTEDLQAGVDVSYGRFNDTDISGFVSGPLLGKLKGRAAARFNQSGPWQKGYGEQEGQMFGGKDFMNFRASLLWDPVSWFKIYVPASAWIDKGWSQAGQLYGVAPTNSVAQLSPAIANYPLAPHNNQAAAWNTCVNNDPFNPIKNQQLGATINAPNGTPESIGPGSVAQLGGQPTKCEPARKDNTFFSISPRMDFELGGGVKLTSLTSFDLFNRHQAVDPTGMPFQDIQAVLTGQVTAAFQELRLAGDLFGSLKWLAGGNYAHYETRDQAFESYAASTETPVILEILNGNPITLPLGPIRNINDESTNAWAIFLHAEYPILDSLTVLGGVRYAQQNTTARLCGLDSGDGTLAAVSQALQGAFGSTTPVLVAPGGCATVGQASNNFNPPANGELYTLALNESNVPWQAGVNWKPIADTLLYANFSQGYKAGSFPLVAFSTYSTFRPAVQESLLSYEGGVKSSLLQWTLQLNGAFFYYDYSNKQILGAISDPLFGALPVLINIPKSHVIGFEISGAYSPKWLDGLRLSAALSYQHSEIDTSANNVCSPPAAQDPNVPTSNGSVPGSAGPNPGLIQCEAGHFYNFDRFNQYADFTGKSFPDAPEWQGAVDAEYTWHVAKGINLYVGGAVKFVTSTVGFLTNPNPIPAFENVGFPTPGGQVITAANPVFGGYLDCAGNPSAVPVGPCPNNHPSDPLAIPGYALVDLRVGATYCNWEFQAWGRNVGDTWYWTNAFNIIDNLTRFTGMPITYGATVSYRY